MKASIIFGSFSFEASSGYPTPQITTSLSRKRTSAQHYIGSTHTINLDGFVSGVGITGLFEKALNLRNRLVLSDPQQFIFQIGSTPILSGTGYTTAISFNTDRDHALNTVNYQVSIDFDDTTSGNRTANSDSIYHVANIEDNLTISVSSESYNIGDILYPLYNINRTLSARGNRYSSSSGAIVEALRWINDRRANFPLTGLVPTDKLPLFDHNRIIDINELDGSINVSDKFVSKPINSGEPWTNNLTVSTSIKEDLTHEISIKGIIKGLVPVKDFIIIDGPISLAVHTSGSKLLEPIGTIANTGDTKYNMAMSGYRNITGSLYSIATKYYNNLVTNLTNNDYPYNYPFTSWSRTPINQTPLNFVETFNPFNGEVTYNYSFDNRPKSLISGAISENITVNDSSPTQRTSSIPVLGRRLGPLVYFYTSSSGLGNRSVSYEGVFTTPTGLSNITISMDILKAIDNLVNSFGPDSSYSGYITADDQRINISENRITRSKTWSYTRDQ